jgi:5-methylcytosine-specific restriction enzyme subunit McrC
METRQLREWTLTPSLTLTGPQRDTLRTVLKATVQPTFGSNDRYDVTPGNTVGAVMVDDTTFIVEPKIPISRFLFMLGYTADPSGWRQEDANLGDATDLISGVTALFTNLCDRALA